VTASEESTAEKIARLKERNRALRAQNDALRAECDSLRDKNRTLKSSREPASALAPPPAIAEKPREIDLRDELIPLALKDPASVRSQLDTEARERFGDTTEIGRDVRVRFPVDRLVAIPHSEFTKDPLGKTVADATEELIAALRDFSLDVFIPHLGPNVGYDLAGYLRQTRIRVIAALEELKRRGFSTGRVLDLGSLYGAFALPLQRLGYEVTAVDRYREYAGLEGIVDMLQSSGVRVVPTRRADELSVIESLGTFDVVISMAVIEHIPHTPRLFLEGLRSHIRGGGLLMLDSPNLVRYWHRAAMNEGRSVFMDLTSQYYAQIPFEGHHREYTGAEMAWMLEQIGCSDVRVHYLESNMFQFEAIDRPHLECLLALVLDPTKADTLLASGTVNPV